MNKTGIKDFDYSILKQFLLQERTAEEIINHFEIKNYSTFIAIIHNATFKMLIYEGENDKGKLIWGVLSSATP